MKHEFIRFITSSAVIFAVALSGFSKTNADLQNMAAAEKAFSATAVKEGFRDSFIKFFADDGIGFGPAPEILKEKLIKTPPQTQPRQVIFKWQPAFCDMSLGGDMGYSTGPLVFEDVGENKRPPRHGMYFSVWQKQSDGQWKVAIDMGVDTPEAIAPIDTDFVVAVNPNGVDKSKAKKLTDGNFTTLDALFSAEIEKSGASKAYENFSSSEFRVHRRGFMPITTKAALKNYLDAGSGKIAFTRLGGKISQLKDFAFTYGSFQLDGKDSPDGFYIHVWRRDKAGKWKLVVDVASDLPKKQS